MIRGEGEAFDGGEAEVSGAADLALRSVASSLRTPSVFVPAGPDSSISAVRKLVIQDSCSTKSGSISAN